MCNMLSASALIRQFHGHGLIMISDDCDPEKKIVLFGAEISGNSHSFVFNIGANISEISIDLKNRAVRLDPVGNYGSRGINF